MTGISIAELMANPKAVIPTIEEPVKHRRMFTGRLFDVTGHKLDGSTITYNGLGRVAANHKRDALRRQGYNRIDIIEVQTIIFEDSEYRALRFDDNHQVPVKVNPIAAPEYIANDVQKTFAWDVLDNNAPTAFLPTEPKKVHDDKVKAHDILMGKLARLNHSVERRSDKGTVIIFAKVDNSVVFNGSEEECIFWLTNNPIAICDHVFYVTEKVYNILMENE